VKAILKATMAEYLDEVLNGITNAANAIDKSRNRFSQSHFAGGPDAGSLFTFAIY
jgi:hypothetical protein